MKYVYAYVNVCVIIHTNVHYTELHTWQYMTGRPTPRHNPTQDATTPHTTQNDIALQHYILYIYIYIHIHIHIHIHDNTCIAWHDMTWHDMTWHDWHDMTWHGTARYGIAMHCVTLRYIVLHYITLQLKLQLQPCYNYINYIRLITWHDMTLHAHTLRHSIVSI